MLVVLLLVPGRGGLGVGAAVGTGKGGERESGATAAAVDRFEK